VIIKFTRQADRDYDSLKMSGDKQVIKKIKELLESIAEDPYTGIGQPEPLKYSLSGTWSRRINKEHRMVYEVDDDVVNVLSLKGQYD
jgi:toxin YoeB